MDMNLYGYEINKFNMGFWNPMMSLQALLWIKTKKVYDNESVNACIKSLLDKNAPVENYESLTDEKPSSEYLDRISKAKSAFHDIEGRVATFLSCMASVGEQRQETQMAIEPKSIKKWQEYWATKPETAGVEFPKNVVKLTIDYCRLFFALGQHDICQPRLLFYLNHLCEFVTEASENIELKLECLWGFVASMCLTLPVPEKIKADKESFLQSIEAQNFNEAYLLPKYILVLNDSLESSRLPQQDIVLSKVRLFQWATWPLFRFYFLMLYPVGSMGNVGNQQVQQHSFHVDWMRLLDWMLSDHILSLISVMSPQLLRYVAVIAILNRQRQDHFKAAVETISKAASSHSDLFSSLLDSSFVKFDFEDAQDKLALCKDESSADFLLEPLKDAIEENARLLIFQTYCKIQKLIEIDTIAKKLHMTSEAAKRWIINLIRHGRLEAKIDSEKNCVEIASPVANVYQQVLEKGASILVRSAVLTDTPDFYLDDQTVPSQLTLRGWDNNNKNRVLNVFSTA